MLTKYKFSTVFLGGLFVLALSFGGCGSSKSSTGAGGAGGKAGGSAGSTAGASGGGGGAAGGGAGATGTAGDDGGAGATGTAGGDGGTLTPEQVHLGLINATTTGGVMITRAAPKDYATCK